MSGKRPAPPDDGKIRVEVRTNRRSYSVIDLIGGRSRVAWEPGERAKRMDVITRRPPRRGRTGR